MSRCCQKYCIDAFGILIYAVILCASAAGQTILYQSGVKFEDIQFLAGGFTLAFSILGMITAIIQTIRTCKRYRMTYEEWGAGTDTEMDSNAPSYTAYSVPTTITTE